MDERKHVQVIVAGYPGVGKTTVATIILGALEAAGFKDVDLQDDTDPIDEEVLYRRCASITEAGNTVGIQTRSLLSPIKGMKAMPIKEN
jgi:broad-specificity NMP kinase